MSDISKTKELLARADQDIDLWGDGYGRNGIVRELRDALEAKTGIRVDMSSAVGVEAQLAVQGEPNDDREAKAEALAEWQDGNSMRQYSEWYTSWEDGYDAGFSRAAVPDAATEETEWEYGFELIEPDDRNVFEREGDFISAAFAYRAAKKRIDEEHQADLPRLQYLIVRRRKAGPWLPVEGEKP